LKRTHEITRTFTFGLIVIYVVAQITFLALRLTIGDSTWWMGFLNTFARWTFAPLVVLLPLALLLRAKRGALLLLPVAVIALVWFAPYFMPRARAAVASDAPQIRIVTANIWGANYDYAENIGFTATANWLRALDADVILLQEVPLSQRTREDGVLGLGDLYPEEVHEQTDSWTTATLSRLPVTERESNLGDLERAHFQRTVVEVAGQQIAIYNVHNSIPFREQPRFTLPMGYFRASLLTRYDPTWRDQQIGWLLDALERETLPYIVGGDFNMSDHSLIYEAVAARMGDSFREAGWGFGTSWYLDVELRGEGMPAMLRIDYVWHSDDFVALTSEQGPFLGSDHLPLVTTLAFIRG
jgi:endonuclease/exonuclease/phosphatase (EEP) superfamily protein YafD